MPIDWKTEKTLQILARHGDERHTEYEQSKNVTEESRDAFAHLKKHTFAGRRPQDSRANWRAQTVPSRYNVSKNLRKLARPGLANISPSTGTT